MKRNVFHEYEVVWHGLNLQSVKEIDSEIAKNPNLLGRDQYDLPFKIPRIYYNYSSKPSSSEAKYAKRGSEAHKELKELF